MKYIKLNTNESPFSPPPSVISAVTEEAGRLQLYSDPECTPLVAKCAEYFGVKPKQILMTNGSDEILNFAFMAFCDSEHPVVFPEISYGFYSVFAELNAIPYEKIPLRDDFTIDPEDYVGIGKNVVIANPNAPTGLALSLVDIERIVASNPDNVVIIDEAYVDFGAESAVPLVAKYDNLIVTQTFSKSRSLAGGRLGFGIASESLINDMNTIKYSTNPYNVNRMTMMAGYQALVEDGYYKKCIENIKQNREYTKNELLKLGFKVLDSRANFLFAESDRISGEELYLSLKAEGILVRHFNGERISNFNRITIGTREQMETFILTVAKILRGAK
jgi:histidinol-phosphate aminotransferase